MQNYKIKNIFKFHIPYLIFISIIFNTPLSLHGIKYLYILFIIIGILGMLSSGLRKYKNPNQILIYLYLGDLMFVLLTQLFLDGYQHNMVRSFLMYSLFIVYWIIYFNKYDISAFKKVLIQTFPYVYFVAFLAFIQYFFSPTLFGLLDIHLSKGIEWASKVPFEQYRSFLRASSILGSPQIYGLFIALYIIIIYNLQIRHSKIGIIFLIAAGMLSGNKLFFLIIILFFTYKYFSLNLLSKLKSAMILLGIFLFVILVIPNSVFQNTRVIDRITNIDKQVQQEKKDSRIDRYSEIFLNENIFFGSGLGSKTDRDNKEVKVAESYIFQIKYEAGIISFLLFILMIVGSFIFAKKQLLYDIRILIFIIFLSMIIVHAFNSPVFYIFWGILISSYTNQKLNRREIKTK